MSREKFEAWASDNGKWPTAILRKNGTYVLMQTQQDWQAWQAAMAEQSEQLTAAKHRIAELEKDADILQTNLDAALAKIKGFEALVKLIKHHYKIDDKNPLYITTGLLEGAETK